MKKFGILFIVLVGIATTSFGQLTANTAASATIVGALAISKTQDLKFGNLSSPTAATTVTIAADATSTVSDGGNILLLGGITRTNATYHVTGTATATYAITLPASCALGTMTVDNFVSSYAGTTNIGTIAGGGTDDFQVGATLNVANGQLPGVYTGSFDVSIAYN